MKTNSSTYSNKTGFEAPEGYFQELNEKLLDAAMDSKQQISSVHSTGFNTPTGYFDNLENDLIIASKKHGDGKVVSLFSKKRLLYVSGIAAIFIGIISTLLLNPASKSIDNIEISAIEEYIEDGNVDFNFNEVSSFIFDEGYVVDNLESTNYNDDAIFDYLSENIEDPTLMMEYPNE